MKKLLLIPCLLAVGCDNKNPKPPAGPPPMANAVGVFYDHQCLKGVPEISFDGVLINQWSFEDEIYFKLTDSAVNSNSRILDWEAQIIVSCWIPSGTGDIFLYNNSGRGWTSPSMGLVEKNIYPGLHKPDLTPTVLVFSKHSENGLVKVSLGSSRKNADPPYSRYKATDEMGGGGDPGVLLVLKVPIDNRGKAVYSGGLFGGTIYVPGDTNRFRIGFEPFLTPDEAKTKFNLAMDRWVLQNPKPQRLMSKLAASDCITEPVDSDGDMLADSVDVCPIDAGKTVYAGLCGCGFPETNPFCTVPFGDYDKDGDVDMDDFGEFQKCYGSTLTDPSWTKCKIWDWDSDNRIGQPFGSNLPDQDIAKLQECASRSGVHTLCKP